MINFDDVSKKPKEHNLNQLQLPDYPCRLIIVGGFGSGKTNSLLNQISHQPDIDKIYVYANDPHEAKYQLLIDIQKNTSLKHFSNPKAFIEYSNYLDNIYKNMDEYNPNKERKQYLMVSLLIVIYVSNI